MPDREALPRTGTLMQGKRGLVMGVANERSLAWGIAAACAAQGAELAFTYQGEALGSRVRPLAESVGAPLVLPCDVADDASIDAAFARSRRAGTGSISWSTRSARPTRPICAGRYLDTPREAFLQALDISCYSFTAVCRRAVPLMPRGGSLLTLTYLGAERVMPHYNVMGVAKAALEASVRYLAADLGGAEHPRQRDLRRADQDPGGERHRRFPLHPALEPAQFAAAAATSPSRRSAAPASTCCPTSPPASPARCTMSIAATISSA